MRTYIIIFNYIQIIFSRGTPMEANLKLEQTREVDEYIKYRILIGELLYISVENKRASSPRWELLYAGLPDGDLLSF